ncbi:cobalamin biosynthesis protein CbiX [Halarcobacter ebronensis]|uniref:Cobalamin biosynthesis protein CbiX n=1 Tax=Halarcobacter ebronensis TaxID=1462615 RepID=A0A4Q0YA86_9BACT|nr:CbiX/SirB N-terminal domain-containing protein [Halarcobacter ebronensis]RXJ66424.1 cobalamin biosynthesis protein CbiX [Halarcobacter ebronensis]
MKALIFVAHGSKKELSNNEFISMVESIKQRVNSYDIIKASFLEIAEPSINDASKRAIEAGAKEIYYYPFFLNSGRHVAVDIPNIIYTLKNSYDDVEFKILEHFGKSEYIEDIVLKDIYRSR